MQPLTPEGMAMGCDLSGALLSPGVSVTSGSRLTMIGTAFVERPSASCNVAQRRPSGVSPGSVSVAVGSVGKLYPISRRLVGFPGVTRDGKTFVTNGRSLISME